MVKNLIFYNHYGNGDLFISREFVKEIIQIIPAENYYYAHAKNERMFADIQFLQPAKIDDRFRMRSRYEKSDNEILINTWLGVDSTYVTRANSCSIYNSYNMFNHILSELGHAKLSQELVNYIPSVDYSRFDIKHVQEFVDENKDFVLICNCQAQSGQAENFDMRDVIQNVCDTYPNKLFVVSDPVDVIAPNYITTKEVTQTNDGFDLNEISYLSKFSNVIIGRSSGPHIFSMTKENCMDPNKIFLSFTYRREAAHIIWEIPKINAEIMWSNSTDINKVYKTMCEAIEKGKAI